MGRRLLLAVGKARGAEGGVDLCEAVEEGFWQTFPAPPLGKGVLRSKHPEAFGAIKSLAQLRYKSLSAVIQTRIETFQHALAGEVEFVQQHPMPIFEGLEKNAVVP